MWIWKRPTWQQRRKEEVGHCFLFLLQEVQNLNIVHRYQCSSLLVSPHFSFTKIQVSNFHVCHFCTMFGKERNINIQCWIMNELKSKNEFELLLIYIISTYLFFCWYMYLRLAWSHGWEVWYPYPFPHTHSPWT